VLKGAEALRTNSLMEEGGKHSNKNKNHRRQSSSTSTKKKIATTKRSRRVKGLIQSPSTKIKKNAQRRKGYCKC